jgi:uncharacterized delta-60 repeat protein
LALPLLGLSAAGLSQTPDAFNPGPDNSVTAMAIQADGKVLAGGAFSTLVSGQAGPAYFGRLNTDGTLDSAFSPGADSPVNCLAVQTDGKTVVGGNFTTLGGQTRSYIGRFNTDGTLDATFNPGASSFGYLNCLALQADGKILAGGDFTTLAGESCNYLGRLNAVGTLDATFNPAANGYVVALAVQADGKILAGGNFDSLAGKTADYLGRLNTNGTLDTNFISSADAPVYCLAVQADGKILVGGAFMTLAGQPCMNLGRLNTNGALDATFNSGADNPVYSLAVQADGKILVGGSFAVLSGQDCLSVGRLNPDGTLDTNFTSSASGPVYSLALQTDGKVLVGGSFTNLSGLSRNNFGRLNSTDTATQTLSLAGSTITWQRGGTIPEVWRSSFDFTTNGSDWVSLGAGTRIAGGWQLSGVPVPANASLRARGFLAGAEHNGSCWLTETVIGPPAVAEQPIGQTKIAGTTAVFSAFAEGTPPLSYQWLVGGVALANGGKISGAQTPTLTVNNVLGGNDGGYSLVVSNASGSVTSAVATLTVLDPAITGQPADQTAFTGQSATFSVQAAGTTPLSYQWRKGGVGLSGETLASLTLNNLQLSDAANYDVIVTNGFGAVTSSVAVLTVQEATFDAFNPGAGSTVYALAFQPDGEILTGGNFTTLGGQACQHLGRLNPDGSPDPNFNSAASNAVYSLLVQPDGKIVVGGAFTNLAGAICNRLGRLNTNGTLDTSFNAPATGNGIVYSLALQPDGKIVAAGSFTSLAGVACNHLGRLNTNGTLDTGFSGEANGTVYSLALQPDGKILAGGSFSTLAGLACTNLGRLNADGTLDTNFIGGANSFVVSLAVQADGKILAGGNFTLLAGLARTGLGRLNTDGSPDLIFNPGANNYVLSLALQTDGKILAGGEFSRLGGLICTNLGRLNTNGTLDTTFNAGANNFVYSLAVQADGKILVGGSFSALAGQPRSNIGRLLNLAATQTLSSDGSSILWLRSGACPEVWRTTFEASTNGSNWVSLGAGSRTAGGWQLTGLALATNATVRARGFVTGGYCNGSSGFVQSTAQVAPQTSNQTPPAILVNDAGFGYRSNQFGFNFRALSGQAVVILASTNLVNWTAIQTNLFSAGGTVFFSDPDSGKYPRRFYRAMLFTGSLPPPAFLTGGGTSGFSAGQFGFNLGGVAGQTIVIEASTNLVNWSAFTTNTLTSGPLHITDPASASFSRRFYRARLQ